jgi:hypothetical protein
MVLGYNGPASAKAKYTHLTQQTVYVGQVKKIHIVQGHATLDGTVWLTKHTLAFKITRIKQANKFKMEMFYQCSRPIEKGGPTETYYVKDRIPQSRPRTYKIHRICVVDGEDGFDNGSVFIYFP